MNLKEHLRRQLISTRQFTEKLLEAFQKPEEWTHQVHGESNHALWIVGHIGHSDNFFISLLVPDRAHARQGFPEVFGMGSRPTSEPQAYPSVEETLAYMRERRQTLLSILEDLPVADLERSTPEGTPDFLSTYAQVFQAAGWHEGMHAGQLTVVRRALGHAPLTKPPEPKP